MEPLLHYNIETNPFPLQANTSSSTPDIATLSVIAMNNSGKEITLIGITIQFPVGPNADQLTNDALSIRAKAPDNWKLDDTRYSQGFVKYIFYPNPGFDKVAVNQSIGFDFTKIAVNCEPGTFKVEITEGSNQSQSGYPVKELSVTKFPNGFTPVSFCVKPAEIPVGGSTTLEWNGPQGATYSIEYYTPQTDIVKIPAPGQPPLSNQGIYPGMADPPLILQESTMFTLNVDQTIGDQQYHTQEQKFVTVEIPERLEITSFQCSTADISVGDLLTLNWQTQMADSCTLQVDSGIGSVNLEAANETEKSCIVTSPDGLTLLIYSDNTLARELGRIILPSTQLSSITLRLSAINKSGIVQQTLLINLLLASIDYFQVSTKIVGHGIDISYSLVWSTSHASNVTISDIGSVGPSGTYYLGIIYSYETLTLTCQGFGGSKSRSVDL